MNKVIFALILMTTVLYVSAEETMFKIKDTNKADIVLKVFTAELKLSGKESEKLRDFLYETARGQKEVFEKEEDMKREQIQAILARQTGHVEANLESILGKEKFDLYLKKKVDIEKQVRELYSP